MIQDGAHFGVPWIRRFLAFVLAGVLFLVAGCTDTADQTRSVSQARIAAATKPTFTEDQAIEFLRKSPSFAAFLKRSPGGDWACLVDTASDTEIWIRVGHDHPEHFEVDESYKILSNGTVYIMSLDLKSDMWKLDYQPATTR